MRKDEFESLMGREVDMSEFYEAQTVYNHTDLSKQSFCEIWKHKHECLNYAELQARLDEYETLVKSYCAKVEQILARLTSIIESLPVYNFTDDAVCQTLELSSDLENYIEELKTVNHDTSRI